MITEHITFSHVMHSNAIRSTAPPNRSTVLLIQATFLRILRSVGCSPPCQVAVGKKLHNPTVQRARKFPHLHHTSHMRLVRGSRNFSPAHVLTSSLYLCPRSQALYTPGCGSYQPGLCRRRGFFVSSRTATCATCGKYPDLSGIVELIKAVVPYPP